MKWGWQGQREGGWGSGERRVGTEGSSVGVISGVGWASAEGAHGVRWMHSCGATVAGLLLWPGRCSRRECLHTWIFNTVCMS